jgi:hypothetical protein
MAQRQVRLALADIVGMADDQETAVRHLGHLGHHLIKDAHAEGRQTRAATLELDDAVGQGLVQHILLRAHLQRIGHRVAGVAGQAEVTGNLLAQGLVAHFTGDAHRPGH